MGAVHRANLDIFVAIVAVTLIVYIWLSSMIYVFRPWYEASRDDGRGGWIAYFVLLHVDVVMILWSYFAVALTSPGHPSAGYPGELIKAGREERVRRLRWCRKCNQIRPPRTHHCTHGCESCILRMDHHCPWIANCVGFRNHGHFLRFLFYTVVGGTLVEGMLVRRVWDLVATPRLISAGPWIEDDDGRGMVLSLTEATVLLFNAIITMATLLMVSLLFGSTLKNVLQNRTSIEQLEVSSEEKYAKKHDTLPAPFPYDLGMMRNLEQFLGRRRWAWPFPLPCRWQLAGLGDGCEYVTRGGEEEEEVRDTDWPPVEYCSKSSCSSAADDDSESDAETDRKRLAWKRGGESDSDLLHRKRNRRDSEGYLVPSALPWHHQQSLRGWNGEDVTHSAPDLSHAR